MNLPSSSNPSRSWTRWIPLALLTLVWLGLVAVDWGARFHWFQWQRSWISGAAKPRYMGDAPPLSTNRVPAIRGGDLTRMIALPEAAAPYEEVRPPGGLRLTDEYGLPNRPPVDGRDFPVVLVGDSFMLQGRSMEDLPGERLARRLGVPVYTVAHAGRGASFAMSGFVDHPLFRDDPPEIVVWGVSERDATGFFFDSMAFAVMRQVYNPDAGGMPEETGGTRINWRAFTASSLQASLPNTSLLALIGRREWNQLRHALFGQIPPDVLRSEEAVLNEPMLFYRENLKSLHWSEDARDVPKIRRASAYVNREFFAARGITWVVLLIPEKEQVYREALPDEGRWRGRDMPPSSLWAIEEALVAEGIPVVNLLRPFRTRADGTERLYWRDDTHWNDAGMELAAEILAETVRPLLSRESDQPGRFN